MNKTTDSTKYTIEDCGCYVDGARGIYAIDEIVSIAESHGGRVHDCDMQGHDHGETCFESRFAGCEFAGDVEYGCDDYMNTHFGVDGAYWGRNENGDWGLWEIDDYEQHKFN